MATYAIGDVQGCFDELEALLERIRFRPSDRLWFVGDLVNRGPKSLAVLRFVANLGERAVTVLGNHDLHLVTQQEGLERPRKDDTFHDVLDASDSASLVEWLRTRPLMHVEGSHVMVHAGLLPQWSVRKAVALAREVQGALAAGGYRDFLAHLYGSTPDRWRDNLAGWDRLRVIVNAMTRMRFCSASGQMEFRSKGAAAPRGFRPWFELRPRERASIVFGHWSALGLKVGARIAALDSGCVWGGSLTAMRLEDRKIFQVSCSGYQEAKGE
ncbi:MAG: symmetrical bis(5'-nucleosyl)-tetraphosphatase [Betaproteobacteria bacterium]|nr:symmetrical bis(5'-nucleosyl)-tetraphosphatase [Betaproteobacteria bacterium]